MSHADTSSRWVAPTALAALGAGLAAAACSIVTPPPDPEPMLVAQISNTTANLRGVCAVSSTVAWASGEGGTFMRTTNGGLSWRAGVVAGAEALDFRDVHALDANTAWLLSAGAPGRVYRTDDAGKSWKLQHDDARPEVFFDAMAFWTPESGLAFSDPVGGHFLVVVTEDGGETWTPIDGARLPVPVAGEAGFAASGTCVASWGESHAWIGTGGLAARVLRTSDRGASWQHAATPMLSGGTSTGIFSVAFRDARHGVVVGGDYLKPTEARGNAATTADGGESWVLAESPPRGYRSGVAWVDDWLDRGRAVCVAVGESGSDYSVDAGRTWRRLGGEGYHAIAFAPTGGVGWAVGAGGRVARWHLRR